jgi:RNA polymerase sigma-70 factor (ECF subfamily)
MTVKDEERLKIIIGKYNSDIFRYCYSILCNATDAEDAAQATFIKFWRSMGKVSEVAGGEVKHFIYKIAYRTCVDIIRKRRLLLLPDAGKAVKGSYLDEVDEGFPEDLKKALLSLSPMDRALLVGRSVNGLSYDDLSKAFGKSAPALRKKYERVRKRVSAMLKESAPFGADICADGKLPSRVKG